MNDNANKTCIFCLEQKPLTIEHVFPEAIGGTLKIPFVCKDCNSKLGSSVDGKFLKLLPFEAIRQVYGLTGKRGHCPDVFSGVWTVEDPACRTKKARIVNGQPVAFPATEITDDLNGRKVSMAIPVTISAAEQRKMIESKIRQTKLEVDPELNNAPEKLDKIVKSMTDEALSHATFHSERPVLHQTRVAWSDEGFQEYVKIAYELAFCLYGYSYVTKSNTARMLREAVFAGGEALKKVRCIFPSDFPKANNPFPGRELFFWIGDGKAFVCLFGLGALIEVLAHDELSDYPPIDECLSQMVANSPDVQMGDGRWLWGAKLMGSKVFDESANGTNIDRPPT